MTQNEATVEGDGADIVDRDEENKIEGGGKEGTDREMMEEEGRWGGVLLRRGGGFVNRRGWRRI